jgi:hypothetical protein
MNHRAYLQGRRRNVRIRFPRRVAIAALVSLLAVAPLAAAPSASRVIAQYLHARGGVKALRNIRSAVYEGSVTISPGGEAGSYTLITASPAKFYSEVLIQSEHASEGCDGVSCWQDEPAGNAYTLFGKPSLKLETFARYLNASFLRDKKQKISLGKPQASVVNGRRAILVPVEAPGGLRWSAYFDASSHLLVEEVMPASNIPLFAGWTDWGKSMARVADSRGVLRPSPSITIEIDYSNYRAIDGVLIPEHMLLKCGQASAEVSLGKVKLNAFVNNSTFSFPILSHKPLPDIATLLKAVAAHQSVIDKLRDDYTSTETQQITTLGNKEEAKKDSESTFDVFYVNGREIDRLVARNGKSLSEAAQKKEDLRVEKEIRKFQRRAKRRADEAAAQPGISLFLRTCVFSHPRWERYHGNPVIVFNFKPNPSFKPKTMTERALHDFTGEAWVDARSEDVVRLQAWLNQSLKVGGGLLASLRKGSAFAFEQSQVSPQLWMPTFAEVEFSARALLFVGLHQRITYHYSNYKRFHVSSAEKY